MLNKDIAVPHTAFRYEGDDPSQHDIVADHIEFHKIELIAPSRLGYAHTPDSVVKTFPEGRCRGDLSRIAR